MYEWLEESRENPEIIQRKNRMLVTMKVEQRFAIFIFARERRFLIYTVFALLLLDAVLISKHLRVNS
jgi:hypothetical protein